MKLVSMVLKSRFLSQKLPVRRLVLLGKFIELRKSSISFVMSVRPSFHLFVRMERLDSQWMGFVEIDVRAFSPENM